MERKHSFWGFAALVFVVGLGAGFSGVFLIKIQEIIQALAFGYFPAIETSFYEEVTQATGLRRFIVVTTCGLVGGVGWVLIHRYGSPLVTIKACVSDSSKHMPLVTTILHDILQTATVSMGSPLGKEAAPREMSCALTSWWLRRTSYEFDEHQRRLFLATAAGGGLASIYNAPLGGTLFVLETLLPTWGMAEAGFAALACAVAVAFAHVTLGDVVTYPLPFFSFDGDMVPYSLLIGPIIGVAVVGFERVKGRLPELDRKSWRMVPRAIICFAVIGAISAYMPLILGNGQIGNDESFVAGVTPDVAVAYFLAKWGGVVLALAAGAYGGNIQPSIMMGSMLSLAIATFWNACGLPYVSPATAAFIGGTVYLGLCQKMPVTAMAFLLELTRYTPACFFPICLAMGSGILVYMKLSGKKELGNLLKIPEQ